MKINDIDVSVIQKAQNSCPQISVIIRCKNESKSIAKCIEAILNQRVNAQFEIIIIDSGSTDDTVKIAQKYNVTIYSIPSSQFQFGSSINLGIELAQTEYCVFVSAHAIPANSKWLSSLVKPMQEDKNIAGTFGRQLYHINSDFIQKRCIDETFGKKQKLYTVSSGSFKQNLKNISFSNASSCVRRDIALKIKFSDVIASEDREWAYRVMKKGYKILYVSDSLIYHVHNETPDQWYKRIYINSLALHQFAGIKINWVEMAPLAFWKIFKDMKYCKDNNLSVDNTVIKKSIKYEYLYALAHYKGSHK